MTSEKADNSHNQITALGFKNNNNESFGRPPAGGRVVAAASTSLSAEAQQGVGASLCSVVIENARDKRTFNWLVSQVGQEAIEGALNRLSGKRKPYLSNIIKELGVALPERFDTVDKETALKYINELRERLRK